MIVDFVDENRAEFGVEFICAQLQVAPSSYYACEASLASAANCGRCGTS